MSTKATTRCCVQTLKGTRCANEPSPVRPVRMIGPVRLAACGLEAHQRALWSLPGFVRHDAYCGAFGCDRPSNAGICQKHRDMYRDFGITEYALLAQEAPMTEPTITPAPADDGEPSEGDVADAPLFVGGTDAAPELVARWGQVHTAPPQPMSPDLDGLAALAARGQQPTAPGPTLADVQAELARERERADRAELDAVCLLMQRLGSYGPDAPAMLMRLLPVESRRALLEIEAADARGELARARANMVSPTTTEKLAEAAAKVAEVEARIAALDAGDVRG
jgi:hypothetical protein